MQGTHKAGTTSLFRYLADHPDVCASSKKEIGFFTQYKNGIDEAALTYYSSHFSHCNNGSAIKLEASPGYLMQGENTAKLISTIIPNAKLVFILREPVSRLISFFHSNLSRLDPRVKGMSFDDFVDTVIDKNLSEAYQERSDINTRAEELIKRLNEGCYSEFIEKYLENYPKKNICVLFYDDLSANTEAFVKIVCDFAQIDASFYSNYSFSVENKTRTYRSNRIHNTIAILLNKFEPLLNRFPKVTGKLRTLYRLVNEDTKKDYHSSEHSKERLREYYHPHNKKLREVLLNAWPSLDLPVWLREN